MSVNSDALSASDKSDRALPTARASRASTEPASGFGHSAGIANAHTPGPWRWEVNRTTKSIKLCGGPPKRGFGRYDLTVLEFQRYGMSGAAPVFWHWDYNRFVGKPSRADALAVSVEGREHHAHWFADIDHPDARLIAAAPELLDAAKLALETLAPWKHDDFVWAAMSQLMTAIHSAQGMAARSGETGTGSTEGNSPVPQECAPTSPPNERVNRP